MDDTFNFFLENCPRKDKPMGDLYEYWEHIATPEEAWMVAGMLAMIREDQHTISPRSGFDCLAQNAKTVFLARFWQGQIVPIRYDRKNSFLFCDASGQFRDNNFKHYLSFEGSVPLIYEPTEERDLNMLPLGAATIQERWQERDGEMVMFGHIRTLIEVGENHSVWLNGTTNGPTTLILLGDETSFRRWRIFPHRLMVDRDLLQVPSGHKKNRSWVGTLRD